MFYNSLGCQVQHPPQRIIVGKRRFVLRNLTELPVQTLDDVCRVYDFPNLRRIFKEGAQHLPVFLPASDAGRVLFPPCVGELPQILFCFLQRYSGVDQLQVSHELLDILVTDILGGTADLMDNAALETA